MSLAAMKVRSRLAVGFLSLILALSALGGISLYAMKSMDDALRDIVSVNSQQLQLAVTMKEMIQDRSVAIRNVALLTDPQAVAAEAERADRAYKTYMDAAERLDQMFSKDDSTTNEEFRLIQNTKEARRAAEPIYDRAMQAGRQNNRAEATRILLDELRPEQGKWMNSLRALAALESKLSEEAAEAASSMSANLRSVIIMIMVIGLLLGVSAALVITRSILKQLGGEPTDAQRLAGAIASGDLTTSLTLDPRDTSSLMYSLEAMRGQLAATVGTIISAAESISTAAAQIAEGNTDLSQRTEEQAASLEETAASIEELTSTVRMNQDNATGGSELAVDCSSLTMQAGQVVKQVVDSMGAISSDAERVGEIVAVIDSIAFQTNILALNAAVEAARAGEQGRGFAVVATEVRALAQRSAVAAKEIKGLVENSKEAVRGGTALVANAGDQMDKVLDAVSKLKEVNVEIATASREQTSGIEQVNVAVSQMDAMTQQNAALVEESAAAANAMSTQARELLQAVAAFKTSRHAAAIPAPQVERYDRLALAGPSY